jgi:citrate lyase synthetase
VTVFHLNLKKKAVRRSLTILERVVKGESFEAVAAAYNLTVENVKQSCYKASQAIYNRSLRRNSSEIRNLHSYSKTWRSHSDVWLRWIAITREDDGIATNKEPDND